MGFIFSYIKNCVDYSNFIISTCTLYLYNTSTMMVFDSFVIFLASIQFSSGFLLQNETSTTDLGRPDQRYTYIIEKISRNHQHIIDLEQFVLKLQSELNSAKHDMASLVKGYTTRTVSHPTKASFDEVQHLKKVVIMIKDTIKNLQDELKQTNADNDELRSNCSKLQTDVLVVKEENRKLADQLSNLQYEVYKYENTTRLGIDEIKTNLTQLQQDNLRLKKLVDRNANLEQQTNAKITSFDNDIRELKDKAEKTDKNLWTVNNGTLTLTDTTLELASRLERLSSSFKVLNDSLFPEMNSPTQAVVTLCAETSQTHKNWSVIPLQDVKITNGIDTIEKIGKVGMFICETPGIYLIAAYISISRNNDGQFYMMKNTEVLFLIERDRGLTAHPETYFALRTVRLEANDTVYVQNGYPEVFINGGVQSCLSVIQIL